LCRSILSGLDGRRGVRLERRRVAHGRPHACSSGEWRAWLRAEEGGGVLLTRGKSPLTGIINQSTNAPGKGMPIGPMPMPIGPMPIGPIPIGPMPIGPIGPIGPMPIGPMPMPFGPPGPMPMPIGPILPIMPGNMPGMPTACASEQNGGVGEENSS
jgi:hypothetical protein